MVSTSLNPGAAKYAVEALLVWPNNPYNKGGGGVVLGESTKEPTPPTPGSVMDRLHPAQTQVNSMVM